MNMGQIRFQFLMENGGEVQIVADDVIYGSTYVILARDGDKPIFAYGEEDIGYQYTTLAEVGEPYQNWFRVALYEAGLQSIFNAELGRDQLMPFLS